MCAVAIFSFIFFNVFGGGGVGNIALLRNEGARKWTQALERSVYHFLWHLSPNSFLNILVDFWGHFLGGSDMAFGGFRVSGLCRGSARLHCWGEFRGGKVFVRSLHDSRKLLCFLWSNTVVSRRCCAVFGCHSPWNSRICKVLILLRVWSFNSHARCILLADDSGRSLWYSVEIAQNRRRTKCTEHASWKARPSKRLGLYILLIEIRE